MKKDEDDLKLISQWVLKSYEYRPLSLLPTTSRFTPDFAYLSLFSSFAIVTLSSIFISFTECTDTKQFLDRQFGGQELNPGPLFHRPTLRATRQPLLHPLFLVILN